jgi:hypothetical protein
LQTPDFAMDFILFRDVPKPIGIWEESFGPYPWFFAPFIGEFLRQQRIPSPALFEFAKREIDGGILSDIAEKIYWDRSPRISTLQMKHVLSGDLVRLDKAIITIVLINRLIQYQGKNMQDVTGVLRGTLMGKTPHSVIIPSTFIIEDYDGALERVIGEVGKRSGYSRALILDVINGRAVIELIAREIINAAEHVGFGRADLRLLRDRRDRARPGKAPPRPSSFQHLDLEKIKAYYSA